LRADHREDAVPPGPPFFRRCSLACRKAARKKSSSSCCWPIFRSSSAIRRCPLSADPDGDGGANGGAFNDGRAIGRNASGPPNRYRLCHSYSSVGLTFTSAATARTPIPSFTRDIAASFTAADQCRFVCFPSLRLRTLSLLSLKSVRLFRVSVQG